MNAKASNVTNITRAKNKATLAHGAMHGNAKHADDAHKADRELILDGIDKAESLLGDALLEGLRMTIKLGRTSTEEVGAHYTRCNNPAVYASWFNLGNRAMMVVGEKLALQAIDNAIRTGKGSQFQRAREALGAVCRKAADAGVKTVDGRKAAALVKDAVALATDKSVERKTVTTTKAKGAQAPRTATLAAAAIEAGKGAKEVAYAVKLASQSASRLAAPEGRETAWAEAVHALQLAAEKLAVFAK
jgi:hypothetical protein